jgi:hypothetical protein
MHSLKHGWTTFYVPIYHSVQVLGTPITLFQFDLSPRLTFDSLQFLSGYYSEGTDLISRSIGRGD